MAALEEFQNFDVQAGALNLWVFRKSQPQGAVHPVYTGHWVGITQALEQALKDAVVAARDQITETLEYSLLEQNNEGSALTLTTLETNAGIFVHAAQNELLNKKARSLNALRNTHFYTVKIVFNGKTLHAVSRANDSWKTKKFTGWLPVTFTDDELELEQEPAFSLSKYFDFFVLDDDVLISHKAHFETLMSYKEAHSQEFADLQADADFASVFTDMADIINFVGSNKMQLRRAFAIKTKGHFRNANFMNALRLHHAQAGLAINFDQAGRIVPTAASCPDIFRALLDHRLMSRFSNMNYDVPSASTV